MIKKSTTFTSRSVCKLCGEEPDLSSCRKYMSPIHSGDDPIDDMKYSILMDTKHIVSTNYIGSNIYNGRQSKLRFSYLSYDISSNSLKLSYFKRYKKDKVDVKHTDNPSIAYCKCRKTIWIDYSISERIVPENRKKSKY